MIYPQLRQTRRGVAERFNQSLKHEALYHEEIHDGLALVEQVETFRELYNGVRPHEALGFLTPLGVYRS